MFPGECEYGFGRYEYYHQILTLITQYAIRYLFKIVALHAFLVLMFIISTKSVLGERGAGVVGVS